MRSAIATGLVLAGCGFNAAELTPPTPEVTGTLVNRIARNDVRLVPEVTDLPATDSTLRFRFDDGSAVDATIQADGSFTVPRATDGYVVELGSGNTVLELREDVAELVLGGVFAGRTAEALTLPTPITLPASPTSGSMVVASVGQWTTTAISQGELDWRSANPTGGFAVGLLDAATDRLFVLQYETSAFGAGQVAISHAVTAAVDMADGVPVDLSTKPLIPLSPNACVQLVSRSESLVSRFAAALGPGYGAPGRTWQVAAVPSLETLTQGFIGLTIGNVTTLDFTVDAQVADPFPGHTLLVTTSAAAVRPLTLPGAPATTSVVDGAFQVYPAPHSEICAAVDIVDLDMAFVETVEIDGVALASDDQVVAVPRPGGVTVTWTTTSGAADFYDVALLEVLVAGGEQLQFEARRNFRARTPEIRIDESLLVAGHVYVLRMIGTLGVPGASEGNYLDVAYPVSNSIHTSGAFRAQ